MFILNHVVKSPPITPQTLPSRRLRHIIKLPTYRICGSRGWATARGHPAGSTSRLPGSTPGGPELPAGGTFNAGLRKYFSSAGGDGTGPSSNTAKSHSPNIRDLTQLPTSNKPSDDPRTSPQSLILLLRWRGRRRRGFDGRRGLRRNAVIRPYRSARRRRRFFGHGSFPRVIH